MPIISSITQRSPGGKILFAGMYILLTLGSITMVYPFLLLISGSIKSDVDVRNFDVFPKFFTDDLVLFQKFISQRYDDKVTSLEKYTGIFPNTFEDIKIPVSTSEKVMVDWTDFQQEWKDWPSYFLSLGHCTANRTLSEVTLRYKNRLLEKHPNIPKYLVFGDKGSNNVNNLRSEDWSMRNFQETSGPFSNDYLELRSEMHQRYFRPVSLDITYFARVRTQFKGNKGMKSFNEQWETQYQDFSEIHLPPTCPSQPNQKKTWVNFLLKNIPARFITFSPGMQKTYREFLQKKFKTIEKLNATYKTTFPSWNEVAFVPHQSSRAASLDVENEFLPSLKTYDGIILDTPDFRWRDHLSKKYNHDISALNLAHKTQYRDFQEIRMPILEYDWSILKAHRSEIMWEMATRNYRIVWNYITNQAHAIRNTILFCSLSILIHLIVNPLAAYALSRFQPRWGYQLLFILMATMAFPHEVTQIPSFLLVRELGWLNTFYALIIPSAANGYSIFLLKGFFDSLPKDLYESATLDGASELRVFFTITIPLSGPILAVIALNAFTSAYGAFMFALLVCQDESMWTIMVYIYQLQQMFNTPVVFASLIIAAVPTLLVFIFCQNIIMRGIVVPVEK